MPSEPVRSRAREAFSNKGKVNAMNSTQGKKIVIQFLLSTFAIMITFWGICLVAAQMGVFMTDAPWLYPLYIIGAGSPAIASYFVLKRNGIVKGFIPWLKAMFDVKKPIWMYLLTVGLCILYYAIVIGISGVGEMKPLYTFLYLTPFMLIGGGHEETGWRHILQSAFESKAGFVVSALVTGIIWSIWHLPLFYIPGVGQYNESFLIFAIYVIGISFAYGAIKKVTGSTFLCILFHCLFNASSTVLNPNMTLLNSCVASLVLVVISFIIVRIFTHKQKSKQYLHSS